MNRLLPTLVLLAACASSPDAGPSRAADTRLVHDVFFTLQDSSPEACDALATACLALAEIPGVVHLTAGVRDASQQRNVNRADYHVGLHVEFDSAEAYDAYGPHPVHQALVETHKGNFAAVEVFDYLPTGR